MVESTVIRREFWSYARFFLYLLYFFEAGLFLIIAPWSEGWNEAILMLRSARLGSILRSGELRGGVSAVGVLHLAWGGIEALTAARAARSRAGDSPSGGGA